MAAFQAGASTSQRTEDRFIPYDPSSPGRQARRKNRSCCRSDCRALKSPVWRRDPDGAVLCNKLSCKTLRVVGGRELTFLNRCALRESRARKSGSIGAYPSQSDDIIALPIESGSTSLLPERDVFESELPSQPPVHLPGDRLDIECSRAETDPLNIDIVCALGLVSVPTH